MTPFMCLCPTVSKEMLDKKHKGYKFKACIEVSSEVIKSIAGGDDDQAARMWEASAAIR